MRARSMRASSSLLVVLLVLIALVFGCGLKEPAAENSYSDKGSFITVTDSTGREVKVPEKVERIACLYAFTGHVTTMLDKGANIVAVVDGLKRDLLLNEMAPQIKDALVPKISGKINMEELIKARPDAVFLKESIAQDRRQMEQLENSKIPYIIIKDNTIEEQQQAVEIIGRAIGSEDKAGQYLDFYQDTIKRVKEVTDEIPAEERVKIFHSIKAATRTDGPGTLTAQWTAIAGANNVSVDGDLRLVNDEYYAGLEQIYAWDPDVILVNDDAAYDYILENEQWKALRAVKKGAVYKMPNGISRWGHPGSVETPMAILWTAKTLYPDKFTDLNIEEETKKFYQTFFNFRLTDGEVSEVLAGIGMREPKGQQ